MAECDDDLNDLDDGREEGDWKSRYTSAAWWQISIELVYLCIILFFCIALLLDGISVIAVEGFIKSNLAGVSIHEQHAKWVALALAGTVGGTVFDLKWLYHSVAKGSWNRDRLLWRLIVPWNSAMVSLFTGFLLASGVIPFLKEQSFDDIMTLLGCGFLFGYFSDNILAALQNLAQRIFGTLDSDD